jgi:uncharacterized protein YbbC (DUF1343 family)
MMGCACAVHAWSIRDSSPDREVRVPVIGVSWMDGTRREPECNQRCTQTIPFLELNFVPLCSRLRGHQLLEVTNSIIVTVQKKEEPTIKGCSCESVA